MVKIRRTLVKKHRNKVVEELFIDISKMLTTYD
jgi:hypothetical protein